MLFLILMTAYFLGVTHAICDMRPTAEQSSANRTLGNGGYKILFNEQSNKYIPGKNYTITLQGLPTLYKFKPFKHFTLTMHSQNFPAIIHPDAIDRFVLTDYDFFNYISSFNITCTNPVSGDHSIFTQVKWQALSAGSGCVVFTAMILENNERWYAEDGALTKIVCEARTELISMNKISKLVAENIEDKSELSQLKWMLKLHYFQPDDFLHLIKTVELCLAEPHPGVYLNSNPMRMWAFNPQRLKCEPFLYSGCLGNSNRFFKENRCNQACDIVRAFPTGELSFLNQDQTPIDSLSSPPTPFFPRVWRDIPLVKLDDV